MDESLTSVLTQNCWLIPVKPGFPWLDFNVRKRSHRLCQMLSSYNADVIILQEVWKPNNWLSYLINFIFFKSLFARDIIELHLKRTHRHISTSGCESFLDLMKFFDSGLLIASRHAILMSEFRVYRTVSNTEDRLACKGILGSSILVRSDKLVLVFTSHLDASKDESVRDGQLTEMIAFIRYFQQKAANAGYPITGLLLAGDFNIQAANSATYKSLCVKLSALGLMDSWSDSNGTTSDGASGEKEDRIDFIFSTRAPSQHPKVTEGWRADQERVSQIKLAREKKAPADLLKNMEIETDQDRRKNGFTDHAGIFAKFKF